MGYSEAALLLLESNSSISVNYSHLTQSPDSLLLTKPHLTYFILSLYVQIFLVGLFGNILVLYVVIQQKSMRTITNKFIACLSVSDLLICLFAIPFTPMNILIEKWLFGEFMCRLVAIILVTTVFVSTLTSVVIAIDRYMVIVHPHTARMSSNMQIGIIVAIWVMASSTALPIGIYTALDKKQKTCSERWPNTQSSLIYTYFILILQLLLPAMIIAACYTMVSIQLYKRTKSRLGKRDYQKEKLEALRNRKINTMLISMIVIFIISWLPLNVFHLILVSNTNRASSNTKMITFLFLHIIAMSSVMYNPFLYGWMNDNFKKHFKDLFRPVTSKFGCLKRAHRKNCEDGRGSSYTQSTMATHHHVHLSSVNNKEPCTVPLLSLGNERIYQSPKDLGEEKTDVRQNTEDRDAKVTDVYQNSKDIVAEETGDVRYSSKV